MYLCNYAHLRNNKNLLFLQNFHRWIDYINFEVTLTATFSDLHYSKILFSVPFYIVPELFTLNSFFNIFKP